jgi:hypothetical protein
VGDAADIAVKTAADSARAAADRSKFDAFQAKKSGELLNAQAKEREKYDAIVEKSIQDTSALRLSSLSDEEKESARHQAALAELELARFRSGFVWRREDAAARETLEAEHLARISEIRRKADTKDREETKKASKIAGDAFDYAFTEPMARGRDYNVRQEKSGTESRKDDLEKIRASLRDEAEVEIAAYQEKQAALMEMKDSDFAMADERYALLEQLEADHQARMSDISGRAANDRAKQEKDKLGAISQFNQQFFGSLATLMNTKHRELFYIGKAAAMSQAAVNTALAISNVLAQDSKITGSAAIATAAAIGIAGLAQEAAIAGTSFGSGGSGGGGGGVAVPIGSGQDGVPYANGIGPTAGTTNRVIIQMQGQSYTREQVQELAEAIIEARADGVEFE